MASALSRRSAAWAFKARAASWSVMSRANLRARRACERTRSASVLAWAPPLVGREREKSSLSVTYLPRVSTTFRKLTRKCWFCNSQPSSRRRSRHKVKPRRRGPARLKISLVGEHRGGTCSYQVKQPTENLINRSEKIWPCPVGHTAGHSLAVADQDLVASCADVRAIGLQASQHSHGVLIGGLAELTDRGRTGGTLVRRSLRWQPRPVRA